MRINIHYKITVIFAVIFFVILLGVYFYLDTTLKDITYQRIQSNLLKNTFFARTFFEEYPLELSEYGGYDAAASQVSNALGVRVTVIGLDGTVLGDSDLNEVALRQIENHLYRPEVQSALDGGTGSSTRFSTTIQKNMLYIATVFGSPGPQGIIRLSMPLAEIDYVSSRLKKLLTVVFFSGFLLMLAAGFIASLLISRPLQEMAATAKRIAKGDFSEKINIASTDEIGELARSFDDMSEQIRMRIDEVTRNKSRLEAVFLSMFDGVMVVDSSGNIQMVNRALRGTLGLEGEIKGKKPIHVIHNVDLQEVVDKALKAPGKAESGEIRVLLPEEKTLIIHAAPITRGKTVEGAVLVFHDMTGLRRLEKIRRDFVANVSHELRTPVASIKGYAETLLEGAMEDRNNAREFLEIIAADAERLARLIEDLLDLSRIESGKMALVTEEGDIKDIIYNIRRNMERQALQKGVALKTEVPGGPVMAVFDAERISQVLLNLVDNAIKYTDKGGGVTISVRGEKDNVTVSVEDTGCGIPEEDLSRIFERFYRVDKARSRELGGTGLGLSIVKHIVQEHGGTVSVESAVGKGSTFNFTIPKT